MVVVTGAAVLVTVAMAVAAGVTVVRGARTVGAATTMAHDQTSGFLVPGMGALHNPAFGRAVNPVTLSGLRTTCTSNLYRC